MKRKEYKFLQNFDIKLLERRLIKLKQNVTNDLTILYSRLGNYWRIKGDTKEAIECFRRSLTKSPTNPDVLLNLARTLFHINYLDDAIYLTKQCVVICFKCPFV